MSKDILSSAGIADATGVDTFMRMQGSRIFLTEDDLNQETFANDEVLYDKYGNMVTVSEGTHGRYIQEI